MNTTKDKHAQWKVSPEGHKLCAQNGQEEKPAICVFSNAPLALVAEEISATRQQDIFHQALDLMTDAQKANFMNSNERYLFMMSIAIQAELIMAGLEYNHETSQWEPSIQAPYAVSKS